jgi:type IV pilus assembly protein PilE
MYSRYSNNLNEIGFEHEKLATEGGKANYLIEVVESSITGFKARATAVVDFDGDGNFNTWEIDEAKNLIEIKQD